MSEENGLLKHKNSLHKNICAGKFGMILVRTWWDLKNLIPYMGKHFMLETL